MANGVRGDNVKLCLTLVGLPARGKSLIAQKIVRYLSWQSIPAKIFNVGVYRRADTPQPTAEFFDTSNAEGERLRRQAAEAAVNDMMDWFKNRNGVIGILDATNSTRKRRKWIAERCAEEGVDLLFIESLCNDENLIMSNILEVKTTSPDYVGQDPEEAARDFRNRIKKYEEIYQTVGEDDAEKQFSYVKIIDVSARTVINRVKNYLQSRIVYYCITLHIRPRSVWISRHGESEFNRFGKIGGDSDLSSRGQAYAKALPGLLAKSAGNTNLTIWTSTLKRTIQTVHHIQGHQKLEWKALDELDAGVCDGLTYEEIEEKYPDDFRARDADKYNYRYRGGESYRDVVNRLEPIIMELERCENVFLVTHQAIVRAIYAYFMNVPQEKSPWMEIPLHTIIKLTPKAYGTVEERWTADIPAVSTYRAKGSSARTNTPTSVTAS